MPYSCSSVAGLPIVGYERGAFSQTYVHWMTEQKKNKTVFISAVQTDIVHYDQTRSGQDLDSSRTLGEMRHKNTIVPVTFSPRIPSIKKQKFLVSSFL